MKFDPAKSYPHPVLRPGSNDYPHAEFQVEIELDRLRGGTMLRVNAAFDMSDPDLLALVEKGKAIYVLRILAPKTHFRGAFVSDEPKIQETFREGQIHGPVVFSPFLVCNSRLFGYSASGWHMDYGSLSFDVEPGAVLAEDEPKQYWVDTAEEAPVGSIFVIRPSDDSALRRGSWRCQLVHDKVMLEMSTPDYERFLLARSRVNGTADASYIMNAIYLPALIWVLQEADKGEEQYRDLRWYRALDARLSEKGYAPLSTANANRLTDAQGLLQTPFARMPLLVETGEG